MASRGRARAEEIADRVLAALRPQVVRIIEKELAGGAGAEGSPAELTERDLAEAEAVAARWAGKPGRKR